MNIRKIFFFLFILSVVGYFLYEARGILFAPSLAILAPPSGATFNTSRIRLVGRADPQAIVWVDGRSFVADGAGLFGGMITLDPGYNEIGVLVRDRFDNETKRVVKVMIK